MCHQIDKHIATVNALDTILVFLGVGTLEVMPFFCKASSGRRGALCEVLTASIGQWASILQCLDRPIKMHSDW